MNRRSFVKTGSAAVVGGLTAGTLTQDAAGATAPAKVRSAGHSGKFVILSCDGGGMRGYLSSLLLKKLNDDHRIFGTGNKNIGLYAGTSTGGLIALGLASGQSIESILDLYKNNGAKIFSPLGVQTACLLEANKSANTHAPVTLAAAPGIPAAAGTSYGELWQVSYDDIADPSVRTVVEGFIPGNPSLSSLPNKVAVTTFQLAASQGAATTWGPLLIDNFPGSPGLNTSLYDAALSTSAAPVYFPPYHHPTFGWCSDGGLFANNPAPQALSLAIGNGQTESEIVLLSIGTGFNAASLPVTDASRLCYGLKYWAWLYQSGPTPSFPILNAMMDGVSATNDHLCARLLGSRYKRVNPTLSKAFSLDDYSAETLKLFDDTAAAYFETDEWKSIESWVDTNIPKPS